jgi:hypothetical protein
MRRGLRVAVRRDYEGRVRPRIDLRREWKEMVFTRVLGDGLAWECTGACTLFTCTKRLVWIVTLAIFA